MADISNFDASMLVWVDETGFRLKNSVRAYGYSLRGMRATDYQLRVGNRSVNAIAIMSLEGMEDINLSYRRECKWRCARRLCENNFTSYSDAF